MPYYVAAFPNLQKALARKGVRRTANELLSFSLVVCELQLTEEKMKKTMKHGKLRRRFLCDGALALENNVSSVNCTASLPHSQFLSPAPTSVQE